MKSKVLKTVPEFATDEEFGLFWLTHDITDYYDISKAERVKFVKVESGNEADFALPQRLAKQVTARAKREAVPVASLMKRYVEEGLARDRAAG